MNKREDLAVNIARIVSQYRMGLIIQEKQGTSFEKFARELCRPLRDSGQESRCSGQTIKNWSDGRHIPDHLLITRIYHNSPEGSWQHEFAQKILSEYKRAYYNKKA